MNTSDAWVHNLDPFLIQFTEHIGIRWYGLAYLTGFVVGGFLMYWVTRRGKGMMPPTMIADFVTYIVLGTMIGGRIGYALFYNQELLTDFSGQFPYWGLVKVWEGGMASHGGILGIIFAAILFAKRHKLNWLHLGDLTVLGGSVGIFCGRVANFINGELFGREAGPNAWFPVKFPTELYLWLRQDKEKVITDTTPDLLPRMTEAAQAVGVQMDQWNSWLAQVRTSGNSRYHIQEVIGQVISAVESGNEQVRSALASALTARYPSQLYEAGLEGIVTFAVAFWFWRKPRKPGVVGALWLSTYAVMRIVGEQFRMPDAEIGYQLWNLTRGQWLSIGMLVASLALLLWAQKRNDQPIGGWMNPN
jgi:phosphatidylglycerol:prolipoprotein diacylglycerol transferase